MSETTRVNMEWPKELKEEVRAKVGARGLTAFALEAVRTKLDGVDVDAKELNDARDLAQRLADMFVRQSDYEDPVEQLLELQLPAWIDTTGWPEELAKTVAVEEPASEPVKAEASSTEEEDEDLHRPMFMVGREKKAEEVVELPPEPESQPAKLPHDQGASDNLFDKLVAAGKLKPASDLKAPVTKNSPADPCPICGGETACPCEQAAGEPLDGPSGLYVDDDDQADEAASEPAPELEVRPEPPTPVAAPTASSNACPKCGSELVGDECWECF